MYEMNQITVDTTAPDVIEQFAPPDSEYVDSYQAINAQRNALLSGLIIIGLYIGHLLLASNSSAFISTPAVHFFSPLIFGAITYYRLLNHTTLAGESLPLIEGSWFYTFGFPLAIIGLTFLFARLRRRRLLKLYRDEDWIYKSEPQYDHGRLAKIKSEISHFPSAPREFWISRNGLMITGALTLIPLSFSRIQSVVLTKRRSGFYNSMNLTTSSNNPVRIQTFESRTPILVTPDDPDEFVFQCSEANEHSSHLFTSSSTHHE